MKVWLLLAFSKERKKTLYSESSGKSDLLKEVSLWMCRFSAYHSFRCLLSQTNNALINGFRQLIEIRSLEILASIFNSVWNMRIFIWGRNRMHLHSSIMAFCSTHRSSASPFSGLTRYSKPSALEMQLKCNYFCYFA